MLETSSFEEKSMRSFHRTAIGALGLILSSCVDASSDPAVSDIPYIRENADFPLGTGMVQGRISHRDGCWQLTVPNGRLYPILLASRPQGTSQTGFRWQDRTHAVGDYIVGEGELVAFSTIGSSLNSVSALQCGTQFIAIRKIRDGIDR